MDVSRESCLVLVTGASGALGPRVVGALHAMGHRVRTYSLDWVPAGLLPAEVDQRQGEINDMAALREAMQGVNGVIHLAALLHKTDPPPDWRDRYYRVNVEGTRHVLHAAKGAGVRRFVFFSTIAVYGPSPAPKIVLDEATPARPESLYGETKLEAEHHVFEAEGADGKPLGTVLRLGAVYGARIKGNYERLVRSLARGRFLPVGTGSNRRTLVYDRDVANAALLAMEHPLAAGRVYNVTDGGFHTLREVISEICLALDRKPPRWTFPVGPARFSLAVFDGAAKMARLRLPGGRSMLDKYLEDIAVDGSRIQRELGFTPEYDLRRGWRETVSEMRAAGILQR